MLIEAKAKDLGGLKVRRALPVAQKRMVGPFIFFDHMGPVDFEIGNGIDVRPHPHIGLSTLTYLFEGEILHRDTLGYEQSIQPGAVNWMTAGSGVAHSERSSSDSRQQPQRLHGIQTWIALPKEFEEVKASFHHFDQKKIPEISYQGQKMRVIAGDFQKQSSPVSVFSPLTYLHLELKANISIEVQVPEHELAVYVVNGEVELDSDVVREGNLAVREKSRVLAIRARLDSRLLILGGVPLTEDRHIWWNFVSSSPDRIEKAKQDWKEQAFGKIPGETDFIPLPEK